MRHNPVMQVTRARDEPAARDAATAPVRRPRARRGEGNRLRDEIVIAAGAILSETGSTADLSLRSVARAVGVAATSIYRHFADLDELVLAVKAGFLTDFGAALDAAAAAAGTDPQARVRARAQEYYEYGLRNPGRYRVMFSSQLTAHRRPADYLGRAVFEHVRADIVAATGDASPAADLTAVHLWTALHGTVTLRLARRNFPWPELDSQLDDLIDRLLRPPGRPGS
jgi:AcrR family transcriptional regulator